MRNRSIHGHRYLLGITQVRDIIDRLERQLGRRTSLGLRLHAVVHLAEHDAYLDPREAVKL